MTPDAKSPIVFISYSHLDEVWKDKLIPHFNQLQMANVLRVWDDRQIKLGEHWYARIKHVLDETEYVVCLISANFLSSDFCINEEVEYLLQQRRKDRDRRLYILPVLISDCVWEAHAWLRRLQMLPRDGKNVATHFTDDPDQVFAAVARTVYEAISGESPFPEPPPPVGTPPRQVDVSRLPETGELLFGRRKEIKLLDDAWNDPAVRVVAFKAWGGVGKSTLVRVWTEQMAEDNYRGAEEVFAWSFYSQGTGDRVTSADQFIDAALRFLGDDGPTAGSPWDKGERLARLVAGRRTLLLLDGMEPLQSAAEFDRGTIKDPALQTLLVNLARDNPGLCVISTREDVVDLQDGHFAGAVIHHDLEQVDTTAGRALLRVRGIHGTDEQLEQAVTAFGCHALAINLLASYLNETAGSQIAAADVIPDVDVPDEKGKHPRRVIEAWRQHLGECAEVQLLRILGLFDRPATSDELAAVTAEPPIPGLTDKLPIGMSLLDSPAVERLRQIGLIARDSKHRPDILDCHPLIREHFENVVVRSANKTDERQDRGAISDNPSLREAHRRLYEHLKQSAPELPDNLNDMMPLYHAVAHGCKAAEFQDAYDVLFRRIQRGIGFSWQVLGAPTQDLHAVAQFFREPWNQIERGASAIEGEINFAAGCALVVIGQLKLAGERYDQALKHLRRDHVFSYISLGNMSEARLTFGDTGAAVSDARQFLAHAAFMHKSSLNDFPSSAKEFLKDLVHEASVSAAEWFAALLYLTGYSTVSEEVFQRTIQGASFNFSCRYWYFRIFSDRALNKARRQDRDFLLLDRCRALRKDVNQLPESSKSRSVLMYDGLIKLTMAELDAACAIMQDAGIKIDTFDAALCTLRASGASTYIVLGLLSRAKWMIHLSITRSKENAETDNLLKVSARDLSEAEMIAERRSMLIWQIEAALERTRLALCRAKFQNPNDKSQMELAQQHLDNARHLVKQTEKPYETHVPDWEDWEPPEYVGVFKKGEIVGYHCRNDEIERLQAAIDSAHGGRDP